MKMKKIRVFILVLVILFQLAIAVKAETEGNKRIVVMPQNITYKNLPYSVSAWSTKSTEIIETLSSNVEIIRDSPKYAYMTLSVPESEYNQTVENLRNSGYYVRDEEFATVMLNESLPVIGVSHSSGGSTLTGAGRIIAILDTGIDCSHPDFGGDCSSDSSGKLLIYFNTWDAYNNTPEDKDGHGTHVASIAAGTGVASSGKFKGVAPDASLVILKTCKYDAGKDAIICPESNMAMGLEYILNTVIDSYHITPDVISMSLGYENVNSYDTMLQLCKGQSTGPWKEWYDYIMEAISRGIVVVSAAGNGGVLGNSIAFPGCMNKVISVGSVFKKRYNYFNESIIDRVEDGVRENVKFHAIINISGGYNENFEKEWVTTYWAATGFYQTYFIKSPTTFTVRAEGQWKSVSYQFFADGGWEPGTKNKGDKYWEWSQTINPLPSGNWVVLEIGARPYFGPGIVADYWTGWHPFSCDSFDSDKSGCESENGCSWCGCYKRVCETLCIWKCFPDVSKSQCTGSNVVWKGCEGLPNFNSMIVRIYPSLSGLYKNLWIRSGRGPAPQSTWKPDVAAPGIDVCAAKAAGTGTSDGMICGDNNYISMSGTSMATPHVAGLVALLKQYRPSSTFSDIYNSIKGGLRGTDFPDAYREGGGIIDLSLSIACLNNILCRSSRGGSGGSGGGCQSRLYGPPVPC